MLLVLPCWECFGVCLWQDQLCIHLTSIHNHVSAYAPGYDNTIATRHVVGCNDRVCLAWHGQWTRTIKSSVSMTKKGIVESKVQ